MLRLSSNTLNLSLKCSYTKLNKVLWVEPVSIRKHRLSEEIISGKPVPNVKENFISLFAFQLSLRALATYHATAIPKIKITTEPIGPSFACAKAEGIPAAMTKNVMIKHPVFPFSHCLYCSFYKDLISDILSSFYISINTEPITFAMKDAFSIIEFGLQHCSISLFSNMLSYSFL